MADGLPGDVSFQILHIFLNLGLKQKKIEILIIPNLNYGSIYFK